MLHFRRTDFRVELKLNPEDYSPNNMYKTSNSPLKLQEKGKEPDTFKGPVCDRRKISYGLWMKAMKHSSRKCRLPPNVRLTRRLPGGCFSFLESTFLSSILILKTIFFKEYFITQNNFYFYNFTFILYK